MKHHPKCQNRSKLHLLPSSLSETNSCNVWRFLPSACVQYRYILSILGFFGLFCMYVNRVNINVALVAMVHKPTNRTSESEVPEGNCPVPSRNSTFGHPDSMKVYLEHHTTQNCPPNLSSDMYLRSSHGSLPARSIRLGRLHPRLDPWSFLLRLHNHGHTRRKAR